MHQMATENNNLRKAESVISAADSKASEYDQGNCRKQLQLLQYSASHMLLRIFYFFSYYEIYIDSCNI